MNEKPILFNAEMVNAILSGRKTQTRRIMKSDCMEIAEKDDGSLWPWREDCERGGDIWYPCPLGVVGDQLWVRETFQGPLFDYEQMESYLEDSAKFESPEYCVYRADGNTAPEFVDADDNLHCKWRPSIHMPRWASRINLLITGVRVERLQDISEQDAMAEGITAKEVIIETRYEGGGHVEITAERFFFVGGDDEGYESAGEAFAELWDSIYGQEEGESWEANPWVWVINFERMEAK